MRSQLNHLSEIIEFSGICPQDIDGFGNPASILVKLLKILDLLTFEVGGTILPLGRGGRIGCTPPAPGGSR